MPSKCLKGHRFVHITVEFEAYLPMVLTSIGEH